METQLQATGSSSMSQFAAARTSYGKVASIIVVNCPSKHGLYVYIDEVQAMLYWNGNVPFSTEAAAKLATLYPHINKVEECCA